MTIFPLNRLLSIASFLCVVVALVSASPAQMLDRTLELRDGTMLQVKIADVEVPWRHVGIDGTITERPMMLSKISRIVFSDSPATDRVGEVRRLLNMLGSASYQERKDAQDELIAQGGQFKEIIKQYKDLTDDEEIGFRVGEIIKEIDGASGEVIHNQFDVATLVGSDETQDGDAAKWKIEAQYFGQKLVLDRKLVLELHSTTPRLNFGESDNSGSRQVTRKLKPPQEIEGPIPAGFVRVDFDTAPDGTPTSAKQILNNLYIDDGLILSCESENEGSNVAVFSYNVGGLSNMKCAGVDSPPYAGTLELKFCVPGKSNFPAGVKYIGFFASAVKTDGTTLEAYNGFGQLISSIKTKKGNTDYLAIESSEPIAYARIVPQEAIDPDYAIDDLFFTPPRPLVESGDPDFFTIVLNSADRLQSDAIEIDDSSLTMSKLTFTDQSLKLDLKDIAVISPKKPATIKSSPDDLFVQLDNHSILRVEIKDGSVQTIRGGKPVKQEDIVVFWNRGTGPGVLDDDYVIPEKSVTLILGDQTYDVDDLKFGSKWFESIDLTKRPDLKHTYADSPPAYFRKPTATPKNAGVVRTTGGEVFWLSKDTGNSLKSLTAKAIQVQTASGAISIPISEVNSIRMPRD